MEIGEEDVARLEQRDFLRLRLLDLHDHVGRLEHRRGVGKDRRAGLLIGLVRAVDAIAGVGLDDHFMAVGDQLGDRRGGQPDAIFMDLDLFRHPDAHYSFAPL